MSPLSSLLIYRYVSDQDLVHRLCTRRQVVYCLPTVDYESDCIVNVYMPCVTATLYIVSLWAYGIFIVMVAPTREPAGVEYLKSALTCRKVDSSSDLTACCI